MDSILAKYTTDFTALAAEGKLDPVIGRDSEIRRIMQVLSRRTKNNPVLIGEPGVGKTAIIEGLAQRIIHGDVPSSLENKQILGLEMSSILAGAKYKGEFEERFKGIIDEIQKSEGQVIVFVDELHTVVGAGAGEGSVDAGNMLKPGLARGTLRIIGATTITEYRKYIEKDAALERRFQPVLVNPPTVPDTISILRGLKEKYEIHHGIRILDEALVAAADLSDRYITDRFLPDKAIDLIDEASAVLKIDTESSPEKLDKLNRHITQLEIESKQVKKAELEAEIATLKEEQRVLAASWKEQKSLLAELQKIRTEIDQAKAQLESAERAVNLDVAAKIKYGDIPELQKKLAAIEVRWKQIPEADQLIKQEVSADDIAKVVSRWTSIPVNRLLQSESNKLSHLETYLEQRVVGQAVAIKAVANAVRRSRVGISDENRPTASFLFLGPTGVGKTETAKALAEALFDDEHAIIRLDMSEYSERHSVARLIGAPPGYVGYEEGGQLTERVRRHPYSVILLDETEKAHPQVFTVFLQLFDEGRLTDGQGRTVNFKNTVIIMTSNLPTDMVETTFPPEFINRLDQVITFNSLTTIELTKIVELQLATMEKRLSTRDIHLEVTEAVKSYLGKAGFDPTYGARPLKRLIQNEILDPLSMMMLDTDLTGKTIIIALDKKGRIALQSDSYDKSTSN